MKSILSVFREIIGDFKTSFSQKNVRLILTIVIILICIFIYYVDDGKPVANESVERTVVRLTTPMQYQGGKLLSVIGTVRSVSEAKITSERSGRVVTVPVRLGQTVQAGAVIATLENNDEQAALVQAEGVYESAVAASAHGVVSISEAENQLQQTKNEAVSTFKNVYNTTSGIVNNSIDIFFSDPNKPTPGLKINGKENTPLLNEKRRVLQSNLSVWQTKAGQITADSNLENELLFAHDQVQAVIEMTDIFITIFNSQDGSDRYSDSELQNFNSNFTDISSILMTSVDSIESEITNLNTSYAALEKARISSSDVTSSVSSGQVKQALGSLRAAQANFAKTNLRSPIAGTVNELSVKIGDFINTNEQIAVIANNHAFEIIVFVNDQERTLLTQGDSVLINESQVGRVSEVSPAINSVTKKTEVRIIAESNNLVGGETVRITKEISSVDTVNENVQVPLTAIRFELDSAYVFRVVEGTLIAVPVQVEQVVGKSVQLVDGLSQNDNFVVDARGLVVGEKVEIITE